jgi:hypothetical protein
MLATLLLHGTFHIPEHTFLKMSCSQSRQFNKGRQHVDSVWWPTFLAGWSSSLSLIFCKFPVGASRLVVDAVHALAPPCYGPACNRKTGINSHGRRTRQTCNKCRQKQHCGEISERPGHSVMSSTPPHHNCTLSICNQAINQKQF